MSRAGLAVCALVLLRFVAGAVLPLSADEAYYWLWSKHLAAGYYDHPPAIAWLIRLGTVVFGNSAFGVRFGGLLLSVAATWLVWRQGGERAALLLSLMLMIAVETMAATPDAPLIAASAAFAYALSKVEQDARWWLAVGAAGGLALLSKYTGFFLGIGALAWMAFAGRRWFLSPWPYLGALLALLVFAPNLWWNATNDWMTFAFQFGRVGAGHFTLRYLFEFLGAQLLLASPFILIAAAMGLRRDALLAAMVLPAVVYFAVHSLHDRVQGNWPCFLYPMLALAAARVEQGWVRRLAAPVAAVLLIAAYAQALFDIAPLGRRDPVSRLLAFGMSDVVQQVESGGRGPVAIVTTDYATTAWFAFYGHLPVVQVNEGQRWLAAPRADARLLSGPLVYVAESRRDRHALFDTVMTPREIPRRRDGQPVEAYVVYPVSNPPPGRAP